MKRKGIHFSIAVFVVVVCIGMGARNRVKVDYAESLIIQNDFAGVYLYLRDKAPKPRYLSEAQAKTFSDGLKTIDLKVLLVNQDSYIITDSGKIKQPNYDTLETVQGSKTKDQLVMWVVDYQTKKSNEEIVFLVNYSKGKYIPSNQFMAE